MEHENGRECLDEYELTRFVAGRSELNKLHVRDVCECIFYSVHRIVL
jgi:hypothetical protein